MADTPLQEDRLEARVAKLEGLFEQLNKRLGNVEEELRTLRSDMDAKFEAARRASRNQFFWLLGVLITGLLLPSVIGLLG